MRAGALAGQAVTLQGAPLAGATVVLDDGRQQWTTTTDAEGQFRFEGVQRRELSSAGRPTGAVLPRVESRHGAAGGQSRI